MDFLYGAIETDIPPEFVPPEAWPEYGEIAAPLAVCRREHVGTRPRGIRWSVWPLTFEAYVSDEEPAMEASQQGELARNRQAIWRRVRRTDVPPGWRQASNRPSQVDGFRLTGGDPTDGWNHDAKKGLRVWTRRHAGKTHAIERIGFPEYREAYLGSLIAKRVNRDRVVILERKLALPDVAPHIELWGVRDLSSGKVVAGTALIHSPTYRGSTHFAPFITEEARRIYAATALYHHWFARAKERGDAFVVTTNFWFAGKLKSWKGFSEFKSHFGWRYIAYPPELTRFVRGKFF